MCKLQLEILTKKFKASIFNINIEITFLSYLLPSFSIAFVETFE